MNYIIEIENQRIKFEFGCETSGKKWSETEWFRYDKSGKLHPIDKDYILNLLQQLNQLLL